MTVESASFLSQLNPALPDGTNPKSEGDDHVRLIKAVLQATFPSLLGRLGRVQSKGSSYTLTSTDNATFIVFTGGTQLLGNAGSAAATLGSGFFLLVYASSGDITFDPNGAETVNGAATAVIPSGSMAFIICDGVSFLLFVLADADLAAISGLTGTGLSARTAAATWALRILTAPAAGITISNGDGVAGNPTLALANDLAALEGLGSTGIAVRTASDAWAQRAITAGNGIVVTNGDGVAGNPAIALPWFESAEQAVPAAGTSITVAHSLGVVPKHFGAWFRCKITEQGWAVGDEVEIKWDQGSPAHLVFADATNIGFITGAGQVDALIVRSGGFGGFSLTAANWRVVLRAW